jgi:hypothetical protein
MLFTCFPFLRDLTAAGPSQSSNALPRLAPLTAATSKVWSVQASTDSATVLQLALAVSSLVLCVIAVVISTTLSRVFLGRETDVIEQHERHAALRAGQCHWSKGPPSLRPPPLPSAMCLCLDLAAPLGAASSQQRLVLVSGYLRLCKQIANRRFSEAASECAADYHSLCAHWTSQAF